MTRMRDDGRLSLIRLVCLFNVVVEGEGYQTASTIDNVVGEGLSSSHIKDAGLLLETMSRWTEGC
jgi:hypothetical protein